VTVMLSKAVFLFDSVLCTCQECCHMQYEECTL